MGTRESRAADLIKLNDYTERESKEREEREREEAALEAEAERLRRAEEERNLWAATKVQALWRGYLQRKAAAGGGKKGKKARVRSTLPPRPSGPAPLASPPPFFTSPHDLSLLPLNPSAPCRQGRQKRSRAVCETPARLAQPPCWRKMRRFRTSREKQASMDR